MSRLMALGLAVMGVTVGVQADAQAADLSSARDIIKVVFMQEQTPV